MVGNASSNSSLGSSGPPVSSPPHTVVITQSKLGRASGDSQPHVATMEQRPEVSPWNTALDDPTIVFTGALVFATFGLWLFTALLWRATVRLATDARDGGVTQAEKMERSIEQASRSAAAMEGVSESMAINARQVVESVKISGEIAKSQRRFGEAQLRAYITVLVGPCFYQATDVKFQGIARLLNTGATAARDLRWNISAGILPNPLPDDFRFPLKNEMSGGGSLGSQQDGTIQAAPEEMVSDEAALAIKRGLGTALYVWGFVSYKDIFRRKRRTTFAQQVFWVPGNLEEGGTPSETIHVHYLPKHNSSN